MHNCTVYTRYNENKRATVHLITIKPRKACRGRIVSAKDAGNEAALYREEVKGYVCVRWCDEATIRGRESVNPFGTGAPADYFFEQTGQQLLALSRG